MQDGQVNCMSEKIKELWNKIGIQFVKFGLVGVSNTAVSLVTYYLVVLVGGHYLVANALGFVTGTLNAYWWNSHFVFRKEAKKSGAKAGSLVKSFVSYGATFLLGSVLLYIQVQKLGISEMIAPVINVMITTPLNFLLNKLWIFAKRKDR